MPIPVVETTRTYATVGDANARLLAAHFVEEGFWFFHQLKPGEYDASPETRTHHFVMSEAMTRRDWPAVPSKLVKA